MRSGPAGKGRAGKGSSDKGPAKEGAGVNLARPERSGALAVAAFLGGAAVLAGVFAGLAGVGLNSVASMVLPAPPPACPAKSFEVQPAAGLSVKVHNASTVDGLAASTATELKDRGITVESLGNKAAPEFAAPGGDAVITAASGNLASAVALQSLFPRSVFLLDDGDPGLSLYLTAGEPSLADSPASGTAALRCELAATGEAAPGDAK